MLPLAIFLIIGGLLCLGKWYEAKRRKNFILIASTIYLMYLFPGISLIILGLVILILLI